MDEHELDIRLNLRLSYVSQHLPPRYCRILLEGIDFRTKLVFYYKMDGLRQQEMAQKMGISQPAVSKIIKRKFGVIHRRIWEIGRMRRIPYFSRRGKEKSYLLNGREGYDLADANPDNMVFEENMSVQIYERGRAIAQPEGRNEDGEAVPGFYRKHHERISDDPEPVFWSENYPVYDELDREVRERLNDLTLGNIFENL